MWISCLTMTCVCTRFDIVNNVAGDTAEADLKKLDSRIQKCTALARKLKQINEDVRQEPKKIASVT